MIFDALKLARTTCTEREQTQMEDILNDIQHAKSCRYIL